MSEYQEVVGDVNRFEGLLSASQVSSFNENGYTIVDNFLGMDWANMLREECKMLQSQGELKQHYFNFGEVKFEKPYVFECDLYDEKLRERSAPLAHLYDVATPRVINAFNSLLPDLNLDISSNSASIKLQYSHGGSFPYHYDNPGKPSKRKLTIIVYLNPFWEVGDGGELVLWPFLKGKVTVAPKMDRAVLFRSDLVLHRVLPSVKERFCFTIWIDGTVVNTDKDTLLTRDVLQFESYDAASTFFRCSPLQRVISRAVFANEYEESLRQCVGGTAGEQPMLRHHQANVQSLEAKLMPLITALRNIKNEISDDDDISYL